MIAVPAESMLERHHELPPGRIGAVVATVEGKAGVEPVAPAVDRAREDRCDHGFLGPRQAAAVTCARAGGHVTIEVEGRLARGGVLDQPVRGAVERVAPGQHRPGQGGTLGSREGAPEIGGAGGHSRVLLGPELVRDGGQRQAVSRGARQVAVVLRGRARHRDERVSAAVRAAADVGAIGALAVGGGDQGLRHGGQLGDGLVAVVEASLVIHAEAGVVPAGVAGVGADDGKALLQRGARHRPTATQRGRDRSVDPAVRLVEESAVPVVRQPHLEADGIALPVLGARAPEHLAPDQAVRVDGAAAPLERTRRHRLDRGEGRLRESEVRRQARARGKACTRGRRQPVRGLLRMEPARQQERAPGQGRAASDEASGHVRQPSRLTASRASSRRRPSPPPPPSPRSASPRRKPGA